MNNKTYFFASALSIGFIASGCTIGNNKLANKAMNHPKFVPASQFDLSHWKLQVPIDLDHDNRADTFDVTELQTYVNSDYFYLDDEDRMVFTSPEFGHATCFSHLNKLNQFG